MDQNNGGLKEEIGGYFELELQNGHEYHKDALSFNSGRNALNFYLVKAKVRDLFVPYYMSDNIFKSIKRGNTQVHFYSIDQDFQPVLNKDEVEDAHVLCVNYFGICEKSIKESIVKFKNVICDYTQAFFSNPEADTPTYYSPRKFFGVADGGYLYADGFDNTGIVKDDSAQRYMASLVRLDGGAKAGYYLYRNTEQLLSRAKIRRMSSLTQRILASIHYGEIWEIRQNNFNYLHKHLKKINWLNIDAHSVHGPLIYPLLTQSNGLISFLKEHKVHLDQYWPEVIFRAEANSFEVDLTNNLCALPIDQRYNVDIMQKIVELIDHYFQSQKTHREQPSETTVIAEY